MDTRLLHPLHRLESHSCNLLPYSLHLFRIHARLDPVDVNCRVRGMDMFLAIYNIHRDERFWPNPDVFDPLRFTRVYKNADVPEWGGFDPAKWEGKLYPNEFASDFAYLPFGGGARKCVGDEFATLEATVTLAMVLRRFDFEFDPEKQIGRTDINEQPWDLNHPVGMRTGATIHTRNGLHLLVKQRDIAK